MTEPKKEQEQTRKSKRKASTNYAPQIVKLARQFQSKKFNLEDFEQKIREVLGE